MRRLLVSIITVSMALASSSLLAKGKSKRKRPPINPNRQVDITYGNVSWNRDPGKLDEAVLVLRDARSEKIVLINLSENGPDESVFTGRFSVGWGTAETLIPEVYIPLQTEVSSPSAKRKLIEKIRNKKMKRKPFILTQGENGQQVIEVFDTRGQAKVALKNYKRKIRLRKAAEIPTEIVSKASLEVAEDLKQAAHEAARKKEAIDAEAERIRLEQLEAKRKKDREAKAKSLAAAERVRRVKLAKKLANEAMRHYQKGEFPEALSKFEKAVDYDPTNRSYYFAYGATLYSNKKYNKAIVILNTVKGKSNAAQKAYYLGMSYNRIKDYENSIKELEKAKNVKIEPLSSSAAFYQGVSRYSLKKWKPAKESFQWVLDNSKDPRLDEKAEEMIERITKIQFFENNKAKKHILTAGAGLQYDSNVLLQAENASNATASDKADIRFTGLAGYEYRPIFGKTREWSIKSNLVYLYSQKTESSKADPMVVSLSSPYIMKGKNKKGQGYKTEINTKLDMIYMDPSEGKNRKDILDTFGVEWKKTIIKKADQFTKYSANLLNNNSHTSSGDDNSDGLSTAFGYSNTWFLDKKKSVGFIQDNTFTYYSADGKNQKYWKLDITATYLKPINWYNFTQIAKAGFYYSSYPDSDTSRSDTNINLNYMLNKKINDTWNFTWGGSYTKNSSSESSKSYSKFIINSMFTGSWKF